MACQFNYGGNTAEDATLYLSYFVANVTAFMVKALWFIGVTDMFGLSWYRWQNLLMFECILLHPTAV